MKNICVFGMGGIGGYLTARFAAARNAEPDSIFITGIARGESLKAIKEKGLCFRNTDGQENFFHPDLITDASGSLSGNALGEQDIIFLCVKGYDLAVACAAISPVVRPKTVIVPLLNGIDICGRIRTVISSGIVLPACIYISALPLGPGHIAHAGGKGNIIAGNESGQEYDPAPLVSLMAKAGIPFDWQADPFPALWTKYLFIASYGLVTAMSGKSFGQILETPELSAAVQNIIKEIYAIAEAKGASGAKLPDSVITSSFENARNFPYEATTSFARDVQIPGKPNESELFGGTILRLAGELGIPTPAVKAAHDSIMKKC
ncbi:MAG: 2-dehydropantoate 2-reductase [Treponema sp.]|jgi:2-dehydropantoate 2-reductase|nr:2-dehydropantoate 2-reductase [Treponema sp.]